MLCITEGLLRSYKLFAQTYGGKDDQDMDVHNPHTATKLKMVSLYDLMIHPFIRNGHCVAMDSGREVWEINMVSTVQSNRTGGGSLGVAAIKQKETQKGNHKSLLYQHNSKPLTYAIWADNNFVKTLSNFHSPAILEEGIKRRKRNVETNRRDRDPSDVDCPVQQQKLLQNVSLD